MGVLREPEGLKATLLHRGGKVGWHDAVVSRKERYPNFHEDHLCVRLFADQLRSLVIQSIMRAAGDAASPKFGCSLGLLWVLAVGKQGQSHPCQCRPDFPI